MWQSCSTRLQAGYQRLLPLLPLPALALLSQRTLSQPPSDRPAVVDDLLCSLACPFMSRLSAAVPSLQVMPVCVMGRPSPSHTHGTLTIRLP